MSFSAVIARAVWPLAWIMARFNSASSGSNVKTPSVGLRAQVSQKQLAVEPSIQHETHRRIEQIETLRRNRELQNVPGSRGDAVPKDGDDVHVLAATIKALAATRAVSSGEFAG
jgi:hypothetical protein